MANHSQTPLIITLSRRRTKPKAKPNYPQNYCMKNKEDPLLFSIPPNSSHLHFLNTSSITMHNPTTQSPPLLLHHHNQHPQLPQALSPSSSGRRSSSASSSNSPEFEFWMVRNPTQPQPDLLSADQLFLDGVLLPLHLLHLNQPGDPPPDDDPPPRMEPEAARDTPLEPSPRMTDTLAAEPPSTSKRWTDIFKKSEKKSPGPQEKDREKQRREKRPGSSHLAELNMNLWPFSRSRSEGNGAARPSLGTGATSTRRVSSAPCSRSNSGGDPKSRKWPGIPARSGLHLGRTSPVWQVKRSPRTSNDWGEPRRISKSPRGGGSQKARVLNVPMCIGYRHHLSCRTDDNVGLGRVAAACVGNGNGRTSGSTGGGNMFNLRNIFTKKVH